MFGNEAGTFEAWVYPLKILRDLHLVFHVEGGALQRSLWHARSLSCRKRAPSFMQATRFKSARFFSCPCTSPALSS